MVSILGRLLSQVPGPLLDVLAVALMLLVVALALMIVAVLVSEPACGRVIRFLDAITRLASRSVKATRRK